MLCKNYTVKYCRRITLKNNRIITVKYCPNFNNKIMSKKYKGAVYRLVGEGEETVKNCIKSVKFLIFLSGFGRKYC